MSPTRQACAALPRDAPRTPGVIPSLLTSPIHFRASADGPSHATPSVAIMRPAPAKSAGCKASPVPTCVDQRKSRETPRFYRVLPAIFLVDSERREQSLKDVFFTISGRTRRTNCDKSLPRFTVVATSPR